MRVIFCTFAEALRSDTPDFVGLELVDGPLLAFLGLVRPLPQPPGHDHPRAAGQALGDVSRPAGATTLQVRNSVSPSFHSPVLPSW